MYRLCSRTLVLLLLVVCALPPTTGMAQTRTTGQIVGTVKDATGAVVPNTVVILIDTGTGNSVEGKSGPDGGFVFPNLQPGTYTLTATAQGFQPVTVQSISVQTSRSTDLTVQFQVAGVTEAIQVEGQSPIVETTSTTIANTVSNEEIAKLPMAGRNILSFALLVPGAAQSAGSRDSEYNGLPGGAINITLDGVNNNSQRFRSGGTSFFVFAPIRLGAIEELTVSTAGLTSEAGAEGAVQVQFATKRGSNTFRGQFFDTYQSEKLNAQGAVNKSRGIPKTKLRQHEYGGNVGGPIIQNKLFFFANYEQQYSPSENTQDRTVLTPEAQQGIYRYTATDNSVRTINLLDLARSNGLPGTIDPVHRIAAADHQRDTEPGRPRGVNDALPEHVQVHQRADPQHQRLPDRARRLPGGAFSGDPRRAEPPLPRSADQPAISGTRARQRRLHVELLHHLDRRRLDDQRQPVQPDRVRRAEQL